MTAELLREVNAMMNNAIRSYGPGKFSTILDSYVYSVSLDGGADEDATVGGSWYGLMRNGRTIFRDHDPMLESLNEAEQDKLTACAGVIVREDSDGFVAVHYYDTNDALELDWNNVIEDESLQDNN
jgi:hypothetical protein